MHTKVEARLDTAPPGHPVRTVSLPAAVARPLGPPFRGLPRCRTRRPGRRAPRRHTDRRRRALRATRGRACGLWPRTCRRTAAAAAVALGCGLRPGRRRWRTCGVAVASRQPLGTLPPLPPLPSLHPLPPLPPLPSLPPLRAPGGPRPPRAPCSRRGPPRANMATAAQGVGPASARSCRGAGRCHVRHRRSCADGGPQCEPPLGAASEGS